VIAPAATVPVRHSLAVRVSHHAAGNVAIMVAGLVSFPLLTRLLSVEEYGLMNLVTTALGLGVAVAKLGTQHAVLRLHAEVRVREGDAGLRRLASTTLAGMTLGGLLVALLWALSAPVLPAAWWADPRVVPLFVMTAGLIMVRALESGFVGQLRATEASGTLNGYLVIKRWCALVATLAMLFLVARDLQAFYAATITVEVVALVWLARWCLARQPVAWADVSAPQWRAMVAFGLPMLASELGSLALSLGDRGLVQHRLGAEALGVYVAAWNLCDYIRAALLAAAVAAAQPAYLRLWAESGPAATASFLSRFVHVYALTACGLVAAVSSVGAEMLTLLASSRYAAGAVVVPWVMAALAMEALVVVLGAGLYLARHSRGIAVAMLAGAAVNLALNALLLPRLGLAGAGVASFVGYGLVLVLCAVAGRRTLRLSLPWLPLLRAGAFGVVAHAAATGLSAGSVLETLLLRGTVAVAVYVALVVAFDGTGRSALAGLIARVARRFAGARPPIREDA
jgi:O-antigen/teichoic acid export membrane protein